ncbi:MAG: RNA 2',3'-cyclic phosphodiesterase [Candidatus Diapherotrites archaeon]|nr:RNA 2',3'-cyclic phosphodiesterase [Candidatus Diapherotrites archaeon]
MNAPIRVFIAVNLPEKTKDRICSELLPLLPKNCLKVVERENLHITMKFLGYLGDNAARGTMEKLEFAKKTKKFRVELKGIGHFHKRVLWLGVGQGAKELEELGAGIDEALGLNDEKFHSHITLARNKGMASKEFDKAVAELEKKGFAETIEAGSLDVMQSVLEPQGPKYSVLKKIEFG